MKLLRFKYWERESSGEEWEIEPLQFRDFNLIVGRNATGKTRLLKAIARVAGEISGERKPESRNLRYELKIDGDNGAELTWAHRAQYLPFTGQLNLRRAGTGAPSFLSVEQAFQQGQNDFGAQFTDLLRKRMDAVGYSCDDVSLIDHGPGALRLEIKQRLKPACVSLRKLSQAQQRTLAFLIIATLLGLEKTPATLLVDDFAEGLDFESAGALARLVLRDFDSSGLQFIATSNDRYVMNVIPLEYWTVLVDEGTHTRIFNYENSRQKFDDFKFTGLNNFDFFTMDFARALR